MNAANRSRPESDKGELRRQQVLDAATACFRQEGIHGSSIARISQAAGMSPGHIYHYFANKEAIVEAIAEREEHDMADLVRRIAQDEEGGDLVARLCRHIPESVDRNSDPAYVGMILELGAEAARNQAVADILRRSDQAISTQFHDMIESVGAPAWLDEAELKLRMEMIAAVLQGLAMRSLINPDRNRATTARFVEAIIRSLLEERP